MTSPDDGEPIAEDLDALDEIAHDEAAHDESPATADEAAAPVDDSAPLIPGPALTPGAAPIMVVTEVRAHGWRVDHYLSRLYPNFSRAAFQRAVERDMVLVNGLVVKASRRLRVNDVIQFALPEEADRTFPPEDIPLDILYDDEWLVVINKAAHMIVHPGRGHSRGTLASALQFRFDKLSDVAGKQRAGIIHRLDRDTTGVLVVAKDNMVHNLISKQFEERTVEKEYRALVWGDVPFDRDFMETHVRISNRNRERMMVCEPGEGSRHAATFYEVIERFRGFSWMRLLPKTGRTHQLRVHLHHLGYPIVADKLYEGRAALNLSDLDETLLPEADEPLIQRQALHALKLTFDHPMTGERMTFEAPIPTDIERAVSAVRLHRPRIIKPSTRHIPR